MSFQLCRKGYISSQAAENNALLVPGVTAVVNKLRVMYPEDVEIPTDEEISNRIKNIYKWNANLNAYQLSVCVKHGFVTLSGSVNNYWKKTLAEGLAYSVTGVINVTNEITTVPTQNVSDQTIAESIKSAIKLRAEVDIEDIDLKVENGVVTLSGSTHTRYEATAAYEAALFTTGVKDVIEDITVLRR